MKRFKNFFATLTPSKIWAILACALFSFCTTAYLTNVWILRPIWLSPLVFAVIFAIQGILLYTAGRMMKPAPSAKGILFSVAAAVLTIAVGSNILFPTRWETYLSLTAETAGEICLSDVVVDGENIPVAEASVAENSGWLYREQWDNFMIWPEEDGMENRLVLRFVADEVHLGFPYTPYAGSVTIVSSAGRNSGTFDLRCPERKQGEAVQFADFSFDCHHVYAPLELLVYGAGIVPFLGFVFLLLFGALCRRLDLAWFRKSKSALQMQFAAIRHKIGVALPASVRRWCLDRLAERRKIKVNWKDWMRRELPHYLLRYSVIGILFFLSWTQLELSAAFDHWTEVFTMSGKYIVINLMTICMVYLLIHSIVNAYWKSGVIFSVFSTVLSVVNYYVVELHGTPLTVMELRNFRTALNVIGNYTFNIKEIAEILCIFGLEIALCYLLKRIAGAAQRKRPFRRKLTKFFGINLVAFGIFFFTYLSPNPFMNEKIVGAWASSYRQYGYAACTARLAVDSAHYLQKPDGYEEGIGNLTLAKMESDSGAEDRPDIILILNESFYDLSLITDIKTDVPYMKNIEAMENTIRGYAVVPYIGGSTNCSEYELLTSNSLRLMPGVTPFQIVNMKGANTVVSYLKQLGYHTTAAHPEKGSNYNRINAYPNMGFDEYFFYDDFTDRKSYGDKWVLTDESAYENVLLWMQDHTDTPQFMYLLTIQNHGPWDINERKYDTVHISNDYGELNEVIDEYLTGIRMSDAAFRYLTDRLKEYDKKVIVCMVGDHSPSFAKDIVDQEHSANSSLLLRSTPFVIWANFDLEEKDIGTISMNYLVPTLFQTADMPLSQYFQQMLCLRKDVPILRANTYYDKNMNEYTYGIDSEYEKAVNDYFYMEYNNLQKDRQQQLFDVVPSEAHEDDPAEGE